jgi:hypothetical protein
VSLGGCDFCGAAERREWPPSDVRELLDHIAQLDPAAPHARRVGVIFSCIAFERLLEDLLFVLAFGELLYDDAGFIVEALVEAYQGRTRMLTLFKRIGYASFREHATEFGIPEFPGWWDQIAAERNALVHGRARTRSEGDQSIDLEQFIERGLRLFAALHNRYNAESAHFKVATGT